MGMWKDFLLRTIDVEEYEAPNLKYIQENYSSLSSSKIPWVSFLARLAYATVTEKATGSYEKYEGNKDLNELFGESNARQVNKLGEIGGVEIGDFGFVKEDTYEICEFTVRDHTWSMRAAIVYRDDMSPKVTANGVRMLEEIVRTNSNRTFYMQFKAVGSEYVDRKRNLLTEREPKLYVHYLEPEDDAEHVPELPEVPLGVYEPA